MPDQPKPAWRKRCAGNGACVEVAALDEQTRAIRQSSKPDGPWLLLTREQLRELFDAIKARDVVHTP